MNAFLNHLAHNLWWPIPAAIVVFAGCTAGAALIDRARRTGRRT